MDKDTVKLRGFVLSAWIRFGLKSDSRAIFVIGCSSGRAGGDGASMYNYSGK
jgi:hypothetical protein